MKKLIQKWLGITELQGRDKELGKILIPYHKHTDKMISSVVANLEDKINAMARANMSQVLECRIGELENRLYAMEEKEESETPRINWISEKIK